MAMHCPTFQTICCGPCIRRTAPPTHAALWVRVCGRPQMTWIAAPGALRQPNTAFDPGWVQLPAAASPLPRAQPTASLPLPPASCPTPFWWAYFLPIAALSVLSIPICGVKCHRTSPSAVQLPCMDIESPTSPTCQAVCGGLPISPCLTAGQTYSGSDDEIKKGYEDISTTW